MLIAIVDHIDMNAAYEHLQAADAGGINLFTGTVRNHAKGKDVERLVFEAYEPMAVAEMRRIAREATERWMLSKVVMLHVTGERKIGEAVVVVGAAAAHRQESFEACRYLIDELKARVPIWKKEYYKDSSVWVNAHP